MSASAHLAAAWARVTGRFGGPAVEVVAPAVASAGAAMGAGSATLARSFQEVRTLVFGIGAQKSGTTWLHYFLAAHPEVCMPPRNELHYWTALNNPQKRIAELEPLAAAQAAGNGERDSSSLQLEILRGRDAAHGSYARALFTRYSGQPVMGEITPDYAHLPQSVYAQMAALNADTRFVFLMRDPVQRLHSAIRKQLRRAAGGDRVTPIRGAAMLERLRGFISAGGAEAVSTTRYEHTIGRIERATTREKIGLFFYEDIFGARDITPLCDFLSISRHPGDFDRIANRGNPVVDQDLEEFTREAYPLVAPTYEYMAARFGDRLPEAWRATMRLVA